MKCVSFRQAVPQMHRISNNFHFLLLSLSLMKRPWVAIFCLLKFIIHRATVMDGEENTWSSLAPY